ncbi:MAG: EAL domain-containing protein [Limnochordia bacterium]|jgi:PAS domain S-box-containing protein
MLIKILVVDDSASDRTLIKETLKEHELLTASDGREGMALLEEHEGINLLLLDLDTPAGFQVLESLKPDVGTGQLPIIILTNPQQREAEIQGLKLGAVDYIRKPLEKDTLKARIDIHVALLEAKERLQQELDEQAMTFDMIFDQAPIGIAISYNPDPGPVGQANVKINPVFEQITGRTSQELIALGWAQITHPEDLDTEMKYFKKLRSGEINFYAMDKRYIKPDGSIVWVHIVVACLALIKDQHCNHICLIQNITERKAMEQALNECERSKSVFLAHLPGLAYRCYNDEEWTMQYVSQGCLKLTGYPPESLLYNRDLSFNDIISPEYRNLLREEWKRILANREPFKYEYEIITATGEKKWVLELGQGIYNDTGEVEALEGIVLDISDRKAMEDTLKYNSEHDPWTGLYNRDYLVSLLERDLRSKKGSPKALIGINLSMVQLLAANYGYQYSQNLIKKIADALSMYCTENRILFQPRENRFAFYIFDYKDRRELLHFCQDLIDTLALLLVTDRIEGSIGIVEIDPHQDPSDIELLLRRLLIASERYINFFGQDFKICFYDEELEALVNRKRDIVEALTWIAIDDDGAHDDLFLQYQPIISLKTSSLFGFEALARLRTSKLGVVSPGEFMPIAEETKLILPIGEGILRKAFRFLKRLERLGYDDIRVSVNISVIQLLNPDFANRLLTLIKEMQVNPNNIGIEITESVFASCDRINHTFEKLRETGLYIAIDDFGTGYSSLSRETELIADCLKLDKYFVDKLMEICPDKAITGDIISMSHKLGHYTTAEGVEHHVQLEYLKKHGCDQVQGYLISKPLDEDAAIDFLRKME